MDTLRNTKVYRTLDPIRQRSESRLHSIGTNARIAAGNAKSRLRTTARNARNAFGTAKSFVRRKTQAALIKRRNRNDQGEHEFTWYEKPRRSTKTTLTDDRRYKITSTISTGRGRRRKRGEYASRKSR